MALETLGYTGLFIGTFISATIISFPSLIILYALLSQGYDPYICLLVALVGNTLGGLTCYLMGRVGNPKWLLKAGLKTEKLERFKRWTDQYGVWIALLSWVPLIGDALVVAMGFFRIRFIPFLILLVVGKLVRYIVLIGGFYLF